MLSITYYYRNANQNYNEVLCFKIRKWPLVNEDMQAEGTECVKNWRLTGDAMSQDSERWNREWWRMEAEEAAKMIWSF